MRIKICGREGYALVIIMAFMSVFVMMSIGVLYLVNTEVNNAKRQCDSTKALFLAEAGIERAKTTIASTGAVGSVPAMFKLSDTGVLNDTRLDDAIINIQADALGSNKFRITSDATVGGVKRVIKSEIIYNPPSKVFDYGYFLNNWGWFYGTGITANGDVRSNGRFDFQGEPTIEGEVYAGQGIGGGENVQGKAGTVEDGEYIYQHPNSPTIEMPNIEDLSYYRTQAINRGSTVVIGGATVISSVYGDDAGESGNIVLIGTPSVPVEISGPVVVNGDVVIGGTVTGQGTIYAGRNVYVVSNIEYYDPPSSPRPPSDDQDDIDQWVLDNADKDILGFAARESVIMGDYTSGNWQWLVDNYLFGMGSEDVGQDGIPDTGDTGEDDSTFQSQYEDLDEDAVFDDNYNWSDVQTQGDITTYTNVPEDVDGFSDISTDNISKVEGVYYTNHAYAGWGNGIVFNGSVISKDESIAAYNSITFNYDERLHSRYGNDPNWLIDLRLPFSDSTGIVGWWEEAP
ncbi:MAG: hypothetical protein JW800_00880 [Candidatus Omnitrophica bacterium]|nr:hypothetical protein [Candidatus Omnitrophota bacterium]